MTYIGNIGIIKTHVSLRAMYDSKRKEREFIDRNHQFLLKFQVISEIFVVMGYIIGLIPVAYTWSSQWVIPLTVVNLVVAAITRNKTILFCMGNIMLSILSLIPIAGYVFRLIGILISILNIKKLIILVRS